jgi:hypothetical protein
MRTATSRTRAATERHLKRGSIDDERIFDACRARLIEVGEAVTGLDPRARGTRAWGTLA